MGWGGGGQMTNHTSRYLLEWMSKEGWPINPQSFVQPNVLPLADRQAAAIATPRGSSSSLSSSKPERRPVQELVFFARLETRKGVVMFCDAMDQLFRPQVAGLYGGAVQQVSSTPGWWRGPHHSPVEREREPRNAELPRQK